MAEDRDDELGQVPGMDDQPVRWDARSRSFVPVADDTVVAPTSPRPQPTPAATPARKHVVIGPEHVGSGPPGTPSASAPPRPAPTSSQPPAGPAPTSSRRSSRPPGPPTPPRTRPPRAGRTRRGWGPRRIVRILVAALVVLCLLLVGLFGFGWWQFSRIEKVAVASSLSSGANGGTNYLIVGSDSREGISESDPNSGAFIGDETSGQRTDTIMVLRVDKTGNSLLSIPRDLWVTNPATGEAGRINAVYQSGPSALIQAVRNLGIPVNHYLEINFVSFGKLVDALGGITIDFVAPARDTHSGLDVPVAGKQRLGGVQALAFVRSRYYEQLVDGSWQIDGTADLGRVMRQRAFLQALMSEMSDARNPVTLVRIASSLGGGLKIDDSLTYFDALRLMYKLRSGFNPTSATLPVTPRTTSGGASVLELSTAAAAPVITQFGG